MFGAVELASWRLVTVYSLKHPPEVADAAVAAAEDRVAELEREHKARRAARAAKARARAKAAHHG